MSKHNIFYFKLVLLFAVISSGASAFAANAYVVCKNGVATCDKGEGWTGANPIVIHEWCKCIRVSSTNAKDVLIPTKTKAEYDAFQGATVSGVTVSACSFAEDLFTYDSSEGTGPVAAPGSCSKVQIVARGAGGGGGNSSSGANGGDGGAGGTVTTPASNLGSGIYMEPFTFSLGSGGVGGGCSLTVVAAGGAGPYTGGSGTRASPGNVNATAGSGSAAGGTAGVATSSNLAGAGAYGGGGGGGDNSTSGNNEWRKGGGGGGATNVKNVTTTEIIIAGGGGGGSAGVVGGNACNGSKDGQNGVNGGSGLGGSGGGGDCYPTAGMSSYSATGGSGGGGTSGTSANCSAVGANGSVTFYFSY
ncbi:MAG: hypothetical protein A2Z20_04225 [Bdellovibrionales bacterium RBG_16_40_8]|nr:MAG: hypothetical protein A2Z20_04225 [Bdellovibrionales bacterium RBG_16_40_8]